MKSVVLSAALACLALVGVAQAGPVQLAQQMPDTALAYGTEADTGTGALDAAFNAAAGISLTEFTWWGYHLPGSSGTDQFEILLNGTAVGSASLPLGTLSSSNTGNALADPLGGPGTVDLFSYTLVFEPGVQTLAGVNTLSVVNDDFGASWFWQGTGVGNDPFQSAYSLVGEQAQVVPEPGSLLLVLGALAAATAVARRRR
jgi:hypothetical protein